MHNCKNAKNNHNWLGYSKIKIFRSLLKFLYYELRSENYFCCVVCYSFIYMLMLIYVFVYFLYMYKKH